jgi:hypothetical protein
MSLVVRVRFHGESYTREAKSLGTGVGHGTPRVSTDDHGRILRPPEENDMSARQMIVWAALVALGLVIVYFGIQANH